MKYTHTNIVARDWKGLSDFYQNVFRCRPIPPVRDLKGQWIENATDIEGVHIQGIHLLLPGFGAEGPTLEIFQYNKQKQNGEPGINRPGFAHIAFAVEDVEGTLEAVISGGGSRIGSTVRQQLAGAGTITFVYALDPEGNAIELQRWQ